MKYAVLLLTFFFQFGFAQSKKEQILAIEKFQKELNDQYRSKENSPLRGSNFENFKQHPFFSIDLKYRVKAKLTKTPDSEPFELPTSSGKKKVYRKYGVATFKIDGQELQIALYQSIDLLKNPKYKNYLFLPFKDATNGTNTYGGGKYLDLEIPKGRTIIIDFNQSYHPYCAYNAYDYNCPIVPEENNLPIEIKAGVMYDDVYFH